MYAFSIKMKNLNNAFLVPISPLDGVSNTPKGVTSVSPVISPNFMSGLTVMNNTNSTTLSKDSSRIQYYNGTAKTYFLPWVSTLTLGTEYKFVNKGTGDVRVRVPGGTLLTTIPSGSTSSVIYAIPNGNAPANWLVESVGGVTTSVVFSSSFTPLIYTTGVSTYGSQQGCFTSMSVDGVNYVITVSFQVLVNAYDSDANLVFMDLPSQSSSSSQHVVMTCFQGTTGVTYGPSYSTITAGGIIEPSSTVLKIYADFTLYPGDLWTGNFVYNSTP